MTTAILPVRGRPDLAMRCISSLFSWPPFPKRTFVIVDQDEEMWAALSEADYPVDLLRNPENIGYWHSVNRVLAFIPETEPFVYLGQDVIFSASWLAAAEAAFSEKCPDGLGLISFRDDIVNHGNASHGMTTRRWLWVIFGASFFPDEYFHYFCDSELTVRSRDGFNRYFYCGDIHVPHLWEPVPVSAHPKTFGGNDKTNQDQRHEEWINGGLEDAQRRLATL